MKPRFEYDPVKSLRNLAKHGLDFNEAQALWDKPYMVIHARRVMNEQRWTLLGQYGRRIYAAVYTLRHGTVRLISCHRADERLRRIYERTFYGQEEDESDYSRGI